MWIKPTRLEPVSGFAMDMRLYRSDSKGPPFAPVCSWSDSHAVAEARRAQLVLKHGYGTIWMADVKVERERFLDARARPQALQDHLSGGDDGVRVRDAVHEQAAILAERGLRWLVFAEPDQPGDEFVYLAGPAIEAVRSERDPRTWAY